VISEAERAFTYLNLYGFNTDAIIVNRVLPEEAGVGYWAEWKEKQNGYLQEIQHSFHPVPVLQAPMMKSEVVGVSALNELAQAAYQIKNPADIFYEGKAQELVKKEEEYQLYLALPFLDRTQLNLAQRGDELTIQAGSYRRKMFLPRVLLNRPILGARFIEQRLCITFGERTQNEKGEQAND
jgi:arsenite-transporting ATPase